MINCLISDCAGRHTTHVPGGGTAKRFMLFNNKSKTNVAFPPAACLHGASRARAGQWHLARTSIPAGMREQVLDHLPGLFTHLFFSSFSLLQLSSPLCSWALCTSCSVYLECTLLPPFFQFSAPLASELEKPGWMEHAGLELC